MCVLHAMVSFYSIMIMRADVQKVLDALLEKEWSYWKDHKQEWQFVRCLAQAQLWEDLKNHIKGIGETHLKDQILFLIQLNSPRLYQILWGEHENVES